MASGNSLTEISYKTPLKLTALTLLEKNSEVSVDEQSKKSCYQTQFFGTFSTIFFYAQK